MGSEVRLYAVMSVGGDGTEMKSWKEVKELQEKGTAKGTPEGPSTPWSEGGVCAEAESWGTQHAPNLLGKCL